MKAECTDLETEISFIRRLAQGRIDILDAERDRRANGGSLEDLIGTLPGVISARIVAGDQAITAKEALQLYTVNNARILGIGCGTGWLTRRSPYATPARMSSPSPARRRPRCAPRSSTPSAATLIPPAFGMAGQSLHTWTGWGSPTTSGPSPRLPIGSEVTREARSGDRDRVRGGTQRGGPVAGPGRRLPP